MTLAVTKGAILDAQTEPLPEIHRGAAAMEDGKPERVGVIWYPGSQVEPSEKYWVLTPRLTRVSEGMQPRSKALEK
jgi:hypothetical protein